MSSYVLIPLAISKLKTDDLVKLFDFCTKNKYSFTRDFSGGIMTSDTGINYCISDVIFQLIKNNYKFTNSQFSSFVSSICHTNKNQCWVNNGYKVNNSYKRKYLNIITYFFSAFTPNKTQFKSLCKRCDSGQYSMKWLDTLLKKDFKITDDLVEYLLNTPFNIVNYYNRNNKVIPINILILFLNHKDQNRIGSSLSALINGLTYNLSANILINYLKLVFTIPKPSKSIKNVIISLINKNCLINGVVVTLITTSNLSDNHIFLILDAFISSGKLDKKYLYEIASICSPDKMLLLYIDNKYTIDINVINSVLKETNKIRLPLRIRKTMDPTLFDKNIFIISKIFDHFKVIPNLETVHNLLNYAQKNAEYDEIHDLMIKYNIVPTKETLLSAIKTDNLEIIKLILAYKIDVDNSVFDEFIKNGSSKEIIEFLIPIGIEINVDRFAQLLNKGIQLDVAYLKDSVGTGEELYYICYIFKIINKYYSWIKLEDSNIMTMRDMFKSKSLEDIKNFMKNNNLKPDRYCMELSLINYDNEDVYEYLVSKGCTHTPNCLGYVRGHSTRYAKRKCPSSSYKKKRRWRSYNWVRVPTQKQFNNDYKYMSYVVNKEVGIDHEYMAKQYDIDI